jgi:hypothetical protein
MSSFAFFFQFDSGQERQDGFGEILEIRICSSIGYSLAGQVEVPVPASIS